MYAFPPPYVPPEYRNCKYSEIPEPYKSQIDLWIADTTEYYELRAKAAKLGMLIAFAIAAVVVAAIIAAVVVAAIVLVC